MDLYPHRFDNVKFSLEWLSAVTLGYASEQRDILRATPRLLWSGQTQLRADDARAAEAILLGNGGNFYLPDWRYASRVKPVSLGASSELTVSGTGWPYLIGERVAFIYKRTWAMGEVTAVGADSITVDTDATDFVYPTAWMVPVHAATLDDGVQHELFGYDQVGVTFAATITDYRDLSDYGTVSTFDGSPVVTTRDLLQSTGLQGINNYAAEDNNVGPVTMSKTRHHARTRYYHSMEIPSSAEMREQEAYLHTFSGRANKFWKPSWLPDFTPQWVSQPGQNSLFVEPPHVHPNERINAICIEYTDGTFGHHKVGIVATSSYLMTLGLETPLTQRVDVDTVNTISMMSLHRLDTDKVDFTVRNGFASTFTVPTIEVLQ